jgi:hypothetical protein
MPRVTALFLVAAFASTACALPPGFSIIDPSAYTTNLRGDYAWAVENVPFIDFPDEDIITAFYYRWTSYKKHIQWGSSPTWSGWVVTEFLPKVSWARKFNTIPAAAGHHISEGRWIKNNTYIDNYLEFWFRGGGSPRTYSSWIAWAAYKRFLVNGDVAFITQLLPDLLTNLRAWKQQLWESYGGRDCYYQTDGSDAMEVSISGSGCRPTLNSMIFGECVALLEIAKLAKNTSIVEELTTLREHMRSVLTEQMWNEESQSFAVIPLPPPARPTPPPTPPAPPPPGFTKFNTGTFCCDQEACVGGHSKFLFEGSVDAKTCFAKCESESRCGFVTIHHPNYCMVEEFCNKTNPFAGGGGTDTITYAYKTPSSTSKAPVCPGNGTAHWPTNETVTVRELLGYMPFYFSLPNDSMPANGASGQLIGAGAPFAKFGAPMWPRLFDANFFAAKWGLTTAERHAPCYNFSWTHADCWNGPSWPYETARVLTSAANVLHDYPEQTVLDSSQYYQLLLQYAQQHTKTFANNDTAHPLGSGHVFEVLHPSLGYWIDRMKLYLENATLEDMGDDYNHSTFIDLILSGLFGLRGRADDSYVEVNPLIPSDGSITHCAVDHVAYHGHTLAIVWDQDGAHYGKGKGLMLFVDGKMAASSPAIGKLSAKL